MRYRSLAMEQGNDTGPARGQTIVQANLAHKVCSKLQPQLQDGEPVSKNIDDRTVVARSNMWLLTNKQRNKDRDRKTHVHLHAVTTTVPGCGL